MSAASRPGTSPARLPRALTGRRCLIRDGDALFDHYRHTLDKLGAERGTISLIFAKAQNKL